MESPVPRSMWSGTRAERITVLTFWILGLGLGATRAWTNRFDVMSDGLSYIEMGEAYLRGDWANALNGHWSPLYSWIVGAALRVFKPSAFWESSAVHAVNFLIYVAALASFEFLLSGLIRFRQGDSFRDRETGWAMLPSWAVRVVGYSLFLWSCLDLIGLAIVTPDLLVAVWVFLAAGLLLRMAGSDQTWRTAAQTGSVLGLGYLSKTVMFPIGLMFLAAAFLGSTDRRRALPRLVLALAVFLLVSSPYVVALSRHVGQFTIGTSGGYNYARFVGGIGVPVHWQGQPEGSGRPLHPTRSNAAVPGFFEFASPISSTYPPFYDPAYWFAGVRPHFDAAGQWRVLRRSLSYDLRLFFGRGAVWLVGLFTLVSVSGRWRRFAQDLRSVFFLFLPAAAAFGMYGLVYSESRYLGAFVALLLLPPWAVVRRTFAPESERLVRTVTILVVAFGVGGDFWNGAAQLRQAAGNGRGENPPFIVADGLKRLGMKPGEEIGYVGESFRFYWARLVGVRVVAEIRQPSEGGILEAWSTDRAGERRGTSPAVDLFWAGGPESQKRAFAAFSAAGATAVVADSIPSAKDFGDWQRVGLTSYYYRALP